MPYGPHTDGDRERMLASLGVASVDELFADIPAALRASGIDLPGPEPELQLAARLQALAATNRTDLVSFLGAGVYRHWTPPAVDQLLLRGEWYTAYTPYQPEVSQGTLQSIYEYESLIAELVGLDVVSASHYDGAAATAEAALMTCRQTRRERVLVSHAVHPHVRATIETYFRGGLVLEEIPVVATGEAAGTTDLAALEALLADAERPVAGVIAAHPNFYGLLEPVTEIGELAHAAGALFVALIEPVSLAVLQPPGAYGADIAAGEGQPLGISPAVRRAVPWHPRLDRRARPPDPRAARRHDHGSRRPARLRHDDARPRAGHPARQGGKQYLHEPGAARARGLDLPRDDRPARPARRCRDGRRARRGARGGARRGRSATPPSRARTSTSSPCGSRTHGPSTAASSTAASWPGLPSPTPNPTTSPLRTRCSCARRKLTTADDIARFAAALGEELAGGSDRRPELAGAAR